MQCKDDKRRAESMTTFKVGDVVRLRAERAQRAACVVTRVDGDYITYSSSATKSELWHAYADQLELVSRAAPPTYASCTDHGTPPACANEAQPTRLEEARRHVYAQSACIGRRMNALLDELIAAAKAEAIAEREAAKRNRYGRVFTTAGETNYRVTATSKGER